MAVRPTIDGVPLLEFMTSYQREGVLRFRGRSGIYYWATGAGKTFASLVWAETTASRTVVVTKANTKRQWKAEAQRFTDLNPRILRGHTTEPIPSDCTIVILNWEILPHWVGTLIRWGAQQVIYDELHRAKNWKRTTRAVGADDKVVKVSLQNISASAAKLSRSVHRRLGLTATPIRDRIGDLWSQLDIIEPGGWGTNWDFVHRYCDAKPGKYGGLDTTGRSNMEELKERLSKLVHVVTAGELARHLPARRRQIAYLDKEDQGAPARGFKSEFKKAAKAGPSALMNVRLAEAATRKTPWVMDVVPDAAISGQKVVIFTGRRKDCDRLGQALAKRLSKHDIEVRWAHGGNTATEREEIRLWYKDNDDPCVLVGTHHAWGEAIDGLQCTDLVVFVMLPWTPGSVIQSEGRFARHGQSRPVLYLYVVAAGTIDERVAELLLTKLEAVRDLLGDKVSEGVASVLSGEDDEDAIIASILEDFQ